MAQTLLPASYARGGKKVSFFVSTIDTGFGRRGVLHQSPFNPTPFFEDLGRKGRVFTVQCYVMPVFATGVEGMDLIPNNGSEADYTAQRDKLIHIIENTTGSGILVHPTMGNLKVVPTDCSTKFDNKQGRIEYFSITFVEEGERTEGRVDNAQVVESNNEKFSSSYESGFTGEYKVEEYYNIFGPKNRPKPPLKDSFLKGLNKTLKKYLKKFDEFSKVTKTTKDISQFSKDFIEISQTLQSFPQLIIGSIVETFNSTQKLFLGLRIATQNPFDRLKNALGLFGSFFADNDSTVAKYNGVKSLSADSQKFRQAQAENALLTLILSYAVDEIADSVVEVEFESSSQVLDYKKQINDTLNKMALKIGDSDDPSTYSVILDLQSSINDFLNEQIEELPQVKIIDNSKVRPVLVIAYNQFEDTERASEITTRNEINNPNSVEVGELEVLVDV